MRINLKMAVLGALGAASVLALTSQAQADWRYGYRPGLGYGHNFARGYGFGGYRYGLGGYRYGYGLGGYRYGFGGYRYGYGRYRAPYVVGGIYAGAAIAGAAGAYNTNYGYGVGADYQTAPGYGPATEAPDYASAAGYSWGSQSYSVPTTVYHQVTQNYTVPVHSYHYVQHTHYVPVTSYQAVTTNVAVPVTTYQTYQRTVEVPETVYHTVHTCGCGYHY